MQKLHYLDNAATTPVDPDIADLCCDTMKQLFANPSSLYTPGLRAQQAMETARRQVADSLWAEPDTITFTACGTESDNIALQGAAKRTAGWAKNIVTTGFEHPAVAHTLKLLEKQGWQLRVVNPEPDGTLNAEKFLQAVDKYTGIATFLFVNNETGALQDIARLAQQVREKAPRASIHVDGVQGWCKHPIHLPETAIDSFALSGHKMHAPKGIGALYLRKNYRLEAVYGGGGQERGLRPGTENLPYIVALGAVAERYGSGIKKRLEKAAALNERLRSALCGMEGIGLNSPADASPYVLNFSLPGIRSETMLHYLEQSGVYVSSGSACSKGAASRTLLAMGLAPQRVDSALRVSLSDRTTQEDIDALCEGLKSGMATLLRRR
ncbi:MAG: cysteine desulfurase [Pygmaiobacter massiliensis]|nr:cysteine desulfurase [Pygmaiobacter massiliensis]